MRNKILVVDADLETCETLEQILEEFVQEGGEIFFAHDQESGLSILHKEKPRLVFLDTHLVDEYEGQWLEDGVHIVLMRQKHEPTQKSEDFIYKPLKRSQVLEKCQEVLSRETFAKIPPM
ncbi:MAG: hypothetical protein K940chlam9_00641 [Chlamydiae bacterium]|nr:hypothetical protein [Chlamydiota bacterium]